MEGLTLWKRYRNNIAIGKTNDLKSADQHIVGAGTLIKGNACPLEIAKIMNR